MNLQSIVKKRPGTVTGKEQGGVSLKKKPNKPKNPHPQKTQTTQISLLYSSAMVLWSCCESDIWLSLFPSWKCSISCQQMPQSYLSYTVTSRVCPLSIFKKNTKLSWGKQISIPFWKQQLLVTHTQKSLS